MKYEINNNTVRNHVCMFCPRRGFTNFRGITQHIKRYHNEYYPCSFNCVKCDKKFSQSSKLLSHLYIKAHINHEDTRLQNLLSYSNQK